jgi:hypothetical protein
MSSQLVPAQEAPGELPWPEIEGIDTAEARARWCGDVALFASMLSRLLEEFCSVDMPVDSRQLPLHIQRMHKLRGGACMLAATRVHTRATDVEGACKAGKIHQATRLTTALAHAIQSLSENAQPALQAAALQAAEARLTPQAESGSSHAQEGLIELDVLLKQQNLAAVDRFRALSPQLRQRLGQTAFEQMRQAIDDLQFEKVSGNFLEKTH